MYFYEVGVQFFDFCRRSNWLCLQVGMQRKIGDLFLQLHRDIQDSFRQADPLPWPPTPNDLEAIALDATLPNQLVKGLFIMISGKTNLEANLNDKLWRITFSIAQV